MKMDRDKLTRAHAVTGIVEAGKVYLPAEASWLNLFSDETSFFPSAQHDITDNVTQALNYLRKPREPGIFAYYRAEADAA